MRTLRVYLNVWKARGRIEARLSDASAPAYVDFLEDLGGVSTRVVTVQYSAASAGQTLSFEFVSETTSGNVTAQSATLQGGSSSGPLYSELVTFGDSLSDTGNVYALSGFQNPQSPPYFQGRFSDGPLWSEQLAAELGVSLRNEAHSGALSGTGNNSGPYPGLTTQVANHLQRNGNAIDPAALYAIWVGANDVLALDTAGSSAQAAISISIANIVSAIQQLASGGARQFVVLNLPDLGLIPRARTGQSNLQPADLTRLTDDFNAALSAAVSGTAELVDVASVHRQVTNSPGAFGLTNVTQSCLALSCGNPGDFLFYDDLHPTTAGHGVLEGVVADALDLSD